MTYKTQNFDFTNQQGESISGKLELPESSFKKLAIFAHCFTCTKSLNAATKISRGLTKYGIGILRFDFTGLGRSTGDFAQTNFSTNVDDLVDAYHALSDRLNLFPSMIIGHSLGGAAALAATTKIPELKAIVTIGAPSSPAHLLQSFEPHIDEIEKNGFVELNLAKRPFKITKQFIDDLKNTNILAQLKHFSGALLLAHSPQDQTVTIDHMHQIYSAASEPKSLISLDQADHLVSKPSDAEYLSHLIGVWASRYILDSTCI